MVWKYRFAKDMSNKLMTFWSSILAEKGHVWKELGDTTQVRMEVEVGTFLLCNDKNNVVAENVLSYFLCLSSKFEVQVARFRIKQ